MGKTHAKIFGGFFFFFCEEEFLGIVFMKIIIERSIALIYVCFDLIVS